FSSFSMSRPPPTSTLFPYTTLFRSQRLSVKTPVVNIGRADYNDLVVPDPSVSTSHAKLQRREGVWVLVDLDSTNGTFVDGEQVRSEERRVGKEGRSRWGGRSWSRKR